MNPSFFLVTQLLFGYMKNWSKCRREMTRFSLGGALRLSLKSDVSSS